MMKHEEVTVLRKFASSLPQGSYLAMIFRDMVPEIETMIANDFAYNPLPGLRGAMNEMLRDLEGTKKAVADMQERRDALRLEVRRLEERKAYVASELREMKEKCGRLAAHA